MVKNKDDDDEDKQMRKNTGRREEWDQWSVDYLDRVDGKGSDEASWAQRFLGTDVTIGLSAAQQRKRIQDNREAVSDLIRHQEPEDLKQVIRDAAKNRAAPLRSNARLAWQALQASCQIPMTVLQLQAKTKEWHSLSITEHVGVHETSLSEFDRLLGKKNSLLPVANKFSIDDIVEKFIAAISFPASLASAADTMLNTPKADLPARFYTPPAAAIAGGAVIPGGWVRQAVVQHFEELWVAAFRRNEMRFATATGRPRTGPSPRADGFVVYESDVVEPGAESAHAALSLPGGVTFEAAAEAAPDDINFVQSHVIGRLWSHVRDGDDAGAESYLAEVGALPGGEETIAAVVDKLQRRMVCYRCFGINHREADCPSPADMVVTREEAMQLLQKMQSYRGRTPAGRPMSSFARYARGRGGRGGRGMTGRGGWRGKGGGRGGRGAPATAATGQSDNPFAQSTASAAQEDDIFPADQTADGMPENNNSVDVNSSVDAAGGEAVVADAGEDLFEADIFGSSDPLPEQQGFFTRMRQAPTAAACAVMLGVAAAGGVLLAAANRRVLPSPRRLASLLVLAGAQTSHAQAHPHLGHVCFPPATEDANLWRVAAISFVAGGAVMKAHAGYDLFDLRAAKLPTDYAYAFGDDDAPGRNNFIMASGLVDSSYNRLDKLLVDCGCTAHMVNDSAKLTRVTDENPARTVRVANGTVIKASKVGEVDVPVKAKLRFKSNKTRIIPMLMTLTGVLAVPGLTQDLYSCAWGYDVDGISTYLNADKKLVLPSGGEVAFDTGTGRRYVLSSMKPRDIASAVSAHDGDSLQAGSQVHAMLGHFSADRIQMARAASKGLDIPALADMKETHNCIGCALGGASAPHISHKSHAKNQSGQFGDSVSADVCGPFPKAVHTGFRYACGFADRATKVTAVYFMKDKTADSVKTCFMQFLTENKHLMPTGRVKRFHTDNGGEFTAPTIDAMLQEMMTRRTLTVPWTPQRNGQIERFWYTLNRHVRIMLAASNQPAELWPFAMAHVVAIHNRLPTRSLSPPMAPLQAATGKMPDLGIFKNRVWGSDAVVHLRYVDREHKLSLTGVPAVFLGIDELRKGEYFFVPSFNKIITAVRAYKYFPNSFTRLTILPEAHYDKNEPTDLPGPQHIVGNYKSAVAAPTNFNPNLPLVAAVPLRVRSPEDAHPVALDEVLLASDIHPHATVFAPSFVDDGYAVALGQASSDVLQPPLSHKAIYGRPDEDEWLKAEVTDVKAKFENNAFEVVPRSQVPVGQQLVKTKFAYANKKDPITDEIIERRARFIACGYSQVEGTDFTEIACGTLRAPTVRSLFCTAAMCDMDIYLGDVIKAFTQSSIDANIFCSIPAQFNMPGHALRLIKALEGLKQSGHLYQREAYSLMRSLNATQSTIDPNIWYVGNGDERAIVGFWIDDALILVPKGRRDLADKFWQLFSKRFKCKELVDCKKFVGLEVKRDRSKRKVTLSQTKYIEDMFAKFMPKDHSKLWTLPVANDEESLKAFMALAPAETDEEAEAVLAKGYMALLGSLLYASSMTRPDIAFHTAYLAKLMQRPTHDAMSAAQGVLSYLYRTKHLGITYCQDSEFSLWTDSSWGREPKPMAGHVVMAGGAALSWGANALKIVPLSSAEAEAAVLSRGCKDAHYIKMLLKELLQDKAPTSIKAWCDNTAAIDIVKAQGLTARSKHFERWAAYVRDLYQRGVMTVQHVPTTRMVADIFTKALGYELFRRFRSSLLNEGAQC